MSQYSVLVAGMHARAIHFTVVMLALESLPSSEEYGARKHEAKQRYHSSQADHVARYEAIEYRTANVPIRPAIWMKVCSKPCTLPSHREGTT